MSRSQDVLRASLARKLTPAQYRHLVHSLVEHFDGDDELSEDDFDILLADAADATLDEEQGECVTEPDPRDERPTYAGDCSPVQVAGQVVEGLTRLLRASGGGNAQGS